MALILIKEDGTRRADANSYASAADGDAYFDGHLYATAWTAATTASKEKALVFASRLIDSLCQFNGSKASEAQALQWPRVRCPDPDAGWSITVLTWNRRDRSIPDNVVPPAVVRATCELARELILTDRTAAPAGEGVLIEHSSAYSMDAARVATSTSSGKTYDKADRRPVLPKLCQAMLGKFGTILEGSSGTVNLKRV